MYVCHHASQAKPTSLGLERNHFARRALSAVSSDAITLEEKIVVLLYRSDPTAKRFPEVVDLAMEVKAGNRVDALIADKTTSSNTRGTSSRTSVAASRAPEIARSIYQSSHQQPAANRVRKQKPPLPKRTSSLAGMASEYGSTILDPVIARDLKQVFLAHCPRYTPGKMSSKVRRCLCVSAL